MAPFITATVQLLLGSVRTGIQPHSPAEQHLGCHHAHANAIAKGPSLSAISWGFNRMDVFGQNLDSGDIDHKFWDGYQWQPSVEALEDLGAGGGLGSPPAAVSRNTSLMEYVLLSSRTIHINLAAFVNGCCHVHKKTDVGSVSIFRVNSDKVLKHKYFDGFAWKPSETDWTTLVDYALFDPTVAPAASSWGPSRLDVFAKTYGSNCLLHTYYDGTTWKPGEEDDVEVFCGVTSGAAAVSWVS